MKFKPNDPANKWDEQNQWYSFLPLSWVPDFLLNRKKFDDQKYVNSFKGKDVDLPKSKLDHYEDQQKLAKIYISTSFVAFVLYLNIISNPFN